MNDMNADLLIDLATQALERTAFVLTDPVDPDETADYPPLTRFARVAYHGPAVGEIFLCATDGFVAELASSLLGVEPEEVQPGGEGADALRELANILGGSVIRELGGEQCEYSLGLPELAAAADRPPTDATGVVTCCLDSEAELLRITWAPRPVPGAAAA
jgi:hypothetical protein